MLNTVKDFGSRTGRVVLAAVICVLALFVLLSLLRFGFIYWIYATVEDWTTVRLGFDYYVSNLIATAFTAVFSLLVPTLAWYIFWAKNRLGESA